MELGIPEDRICIVFAGKFEPKKQPDFLMNAVLEANKKRRDPLFLLMIGNGPLERNLKAIAGTDPNIRFLEFQNQSKMPLVYRLGSVFCLPSKGPGETWGLAINEAMACGVPAIISDKVGGGQDLIVNDVNGYCFDHSSFEDLVDLLETLSLNELKTMGMAARNHIESFSLKQVSQAIQSELTNLAKT
jgi:glycosyltransferase involved in cell wall biosynthesis